MRRAQLVCVLGSAILALASTGCQSIIGHWELDSISPEQARAQDHLAEVTLYADDTYSAVVTASGEPTSAFGTYSYSGGVLTFIRDDGNLREYHARLLNDGKQLEVKFDTGETTVVAIMTKTK